MKQCPNCRSQIVDEAAFCPVCGTSIDATHSFPEPYPPQQPIPQTPVYVPPVPKINPHDHTKNYAPQDISEHRLLCMLVYLLDFIGIIIGLLDASDSSYTRFHIRQSMKFCVLEILLGAAALVFCWTFVIPILAAIALIVLLVLKFICFIQVCKGKAVEPALIRKLKFLV